MTLEKCPKCGAPLQEPTTTPTGRRIQKCSQGQWDSEIRKNIGCDYVKWLETPPEKLDEECPKCGMPLILVVTRFGKKMKKCSTNVWNPDTKKAEGCDYVEWLGGKSEELNEGCPACGSKLVLYTTARGKRMKKCSTAGWNSKTREATGCTYIEWLKPGEYIKKEDHGGEEFLPPEPEN